MLVDGYIRVSQVGGRAGERFISPAVQREQIEGWAKLHSAQLGEVFEELDESGARADRPLLTRALERIESGESQGLVVAKMDRFGRSLMDGLAAIERIQAAGGTFVSVADGLDLATPTGKLILRIMLSMAEWELDRIRLNWDAARERAIARGVHGSATVPIGYQRRSDRRLELDPRAAPLIAEAFQRRASGDRLRDVCRWLNETGLKTAHGNPRFVDTTLRHVLANRVYLGEARAGPHTNTSAHQPLVDRATWQAAQAPHRSREANHVALLSGLMRCASCRMATQTHVSMPNTRQVRGYRCPKYSSAGTCLGPARVSATEIEPLVEEFFFRQLRRTSNGRRPERSSADLDGALAEAEADLAAYRDNTRFLKALGPERFQAGLEKRRERVERAALEVAAAHRAAKASAFPNCAEIEKAWPRLTIAERRDQIGELIDCLFISAGNEPVHERIHVCRRGTAPVDLPRRGSWTHEMTSFAPEQVRGRMPSVGPMKPWSERRIKRELAAFLGDSREWPHYEDFSVAGRSRLWLQVLENGTPWYWASHFDIPVNRRLIPRWNQDLVRSALTFVLRGYETWPKRPEFRRRGLEPIWRAATEHGGVIYWAEQLGLKRSEHSRGPIRHWTDERIEMQLRRLCAGLETYPRLGEFKKAGAMQLYSAISRYGGQRVWAQRIGFSRSW